MKVNEGLYGSEMWAGSVRTLADYTNCGIDNKNSHLVARCSLSFIHPSVRRKKVKRGLPSILAYCDVDLGGNAASRRNTDSLMRERERVANVTTVGFKQEGGCLVA
jgi:hypothetical protein